MEVEFEGVPSGDGEAFCWDVTAGTFTRLEGRPPMEGERSGYYAGLYRLYPGAGSVIHSPNPHDDAWLAVRVLRLEGSVRLYQMTARTLDRPLPERTDVDEGSA